MCEEFAIGVCADDGVEMCIGATCCDISCDIGGSAEGGLFFGVVFFEDRNRCFICNSGGCAVNGVVEDHITYNEDDWFHTFCM